MTTLCVRTFVAEMCRAVRPEASAADTAERGNECKFAKAESDESVDSSTYVHDGVRERQHMQFVPIEQQDIKALPFDHFDPTQKARTCYTLVH